MAKLVVLAHFDAKEHRVAAMLEGFSQQLLRPALELLQPVSVLTVHDGGIEDIHAELVCAAEEINALLL